MMTRERMAECVALEATDPTSASEPELLEIAAELRKTCATCQHYEVTTAYNYGGLLGHYCLTWADGPRLVPFDGSGYCHRWEGKP